MTFDRYDETLQKIYQFYLEYVPQFTLYKTVDYDQFYSLFIKDKHYFYQKEKDSVMGFISGCIVEEIGYISIVLGNDKISKTLITSLEKQFTSSHCTMSMIHFFNPVQLKWHPRKGTIHQTYQGVLLNDSLFQVYQSLGYTVHSVQDTYYRNLMDFSYTDESSSFSNVIIERFDSQKHSGLEQYCSSIHNPSFAHTIERNVQKDKPYPMLIAHDNGTVIGTTGPMYVTVDHRGAFGGIQILPDYYGKKIGRRLFLMLCMSLKEMGASYMTLFTGRNNPAQHIYKKAGFTVQQSFATMKKTL
jgi:ribosomal protein S18 acetylase RimI-like enzyme